MPNVKNTTTSETLWLCGGQKTTVAYKLCQFSLMIPNAAIKCTLVCVCVVVVCIDTYFTRAHLSRAFLEPIQTVFCASGQLALFSKELSDVALSTVVALHRGVFHSLSQLQLQEGGSGGEEGEGRRGEEGEGGGGGEEGEGRGVVWSGG